MAHLYNRKRRLHTQSQNGKSAIQEDSNGVDQSTTSTTLLVSGIAMHTREDQLYELFGKCGEIKRLVPRVDNYRNPIGECFVEFVNRQSAEDALTYLDGVKFDESELRIKWDKPFKEGRQIVPLRGVHPQMHWGMPRHMHGRGGAGRGRYSRGGILGEPHGRERGGHRERGGRGGRRSYGRGGGRQYVPDFELDNDSIRIVPAVFAVNEVDVQTDEPLPSVDRLIKRGNFGTIPKDSELHRKKAESRGEELIMGESDEEATEAARPPIDSQMQLVKKDLNETKHRLDEFNGVEWSRHTAVTNRSANVMREVRTKCHAEMVDNSWVKMYELLAYRHGKDDNKDDQDQTIALIPKGAIDRGCVKSLFINDPRGSLSASVNHYVKSTYVDSADGRSKVDVEWYSLYNEQQDSVNKIVSGDRRFMDQTLSHWLNQPESAPEGEEALSGDITKKDNILALWKRLDAMKYEPDFIVADGSINVWDNPAEQENLISRLKWCEMIASLGSLAKGGSFVMKYFTTFEYSSIALLYLLRKLFEHVLIVKPYTVKEGNSEVFITCSNFSPPSGVDLRAYFTDLFDAIAEDQEQGIKNMAPVRVHADLLPQSFIKSLSKCAEEFAERQMQAIERNVALFGQELSPEEKDVIMKIRLQTAHEFIKQMKLRPLSNDSDRIVKTQYLDGSFAFVPGSRPLWTAGSRAPVTGHKRSFEQSKSEDRSRVRQRGDDSDDSDASSVYSSSDDDDDELSQRRKRRRGLD